MSDPTAATNLPSPASAVRLPYKRKLSNYLLDKKLQLRYVLFVTILSATISTVLGFMIYQQRRAASESIERDLQELTQSDSSHQEFEEQVASGLASEDHELIYEMAGIGFGLVMILSAYLVLMTHKVAGPLFKVSMYFDRMADCRLGNITPLRRGDMLQDFFGNFKTMHEALRAREQAAVEVMATSAAALRAKSASGGKLADELAALEEHIERRKSQLA